MNKMPTGKQISLTDPNPSGPPPSAGNRRRGAIENRPVHACVRVAVALPVEGTFNYIVPKGLEFQSNVGCRVSVPFGSRKITGYVLEHQPGKTDMALKAIYDVIDPEPLFHQPMVPFLEWMAEYYLHPLGQVIRSVLPRGLSMNPYKTAVLTEKGFSALERLPSHYEENRVLSWINKYPDKRPPWPLERIYRLQKMGMLRVEERMKRTQKGPLMRKFIRPAANSDLESILLNHGNSIKAKNEEAFLETVFGSDGVSLADLGLMYSNGPYLVKKWIKKGGLESYMGSVYRDPAGKVIFPSTIPEILTDHQKQALGHVKACLDKGVFSPCLLYGVTSSGKTEVYCRAVEYALEIGKQSILIVPEISLAMYMESFFRSRLGDRIAIYHSGLSNGQRYDQWMRIARGEADLVIGARSALFAPMPKLGLIIVDEEHDPAYKQETSPRYQARDAAVVRAKMEKAVVLLGSGTPSVQSYQNSMDRKYHLLMMPDRIEMRPLPDVEIVDMKALNEKDPDNEILSPTLRKAIENNLKVSHQTILFLNRRGFHRLFLCRVCGQPVHCPNCDVALSFHLNESRLSCHYCGFHSRTTTKCPFCGREGLKPYGFGTEKLERTIREFFPDACVARMDTDSTQRKGKALQILKRFSDHEIDILVGTQMITKGYDFPAVTLVGIVAADLSLGFPDFRAGERTFHLLSQVAGRAGRGSGKGRVIIQAYNPEHYAIRTATTHDYRTFFEKEKELRGQLRYPPYSYLACIRLGGDYETKTAEAARAFGQNIQQILRQWPKRGKEISMLGPAKAAIHRLKGKYRWQVLLKSRSAALLHHLLIQLDKPARKTLQSSGVRFIVDVDPYQMI